MSESDSIPTCFVCKVGFLSSDTLNYHLWHYHDISTLARPVWNVTEADRDLGTNLSLHSSFVETLHHEVDESVLIVLTTGQNLCEEPQNEFDYCNSTLFDEISCTGQDCDQLQNEDHNTVQQLARDVYESIDCPKTVAQEINLRKHQRNVDDADILVLTTESDLYKELEIIDTDDGDWTSFNETVSTESNGNEPQNTHSKIVQKKRRIQFCDECQEMFSDEDKLKRHKIKIHDHEDKPVLISESQLTRESQNEMDDFNRTSTDEIQLKNADHNTAQKKQRMQFCDECSHIFSNEDMLKRHKLKVHHKSVQKLQVCHECHQIFTQNSNLSRQKTDDKDDNYKCEKCLAISQVSTKSYECSQCSEAFSTLIKLVNHKNNVHWPIRLRV